MNSNELGTGPKAQDPVSADSAPVEGSPLTGHGGDHAVAAAKAHGQDVMWTLSGAHVFPLYDAAVGGRDRVTEHGDSARAQREGPMRIVDVRHEATAVFAAEATGKLTRAPGFAVVTAGPGVTNAISGLTSAYFNGSPLVLLGGRAPSTRWGTGALQELDHPPIVESVTKSAFTINEPAGAATHMDEAFNLAASPHRGPVFVDVPMDVLFSFGDSPHPQGGRPVTHTPDPDSIDAIGRELANASRPVVVLGGDIWADRAEVAARQFVEELQIPVITNGMGRGLLPPGHDCLVTRARSAAFNGADLVIVVGAPMDFRLGYGSFGGKDGATPAKVVHVADSESQLAAHADLVASAAGDLTTALTGIANAYARHPHRDHSQWRESLRAQASAASAADDADLNSAADPIHPARIYGELRKRLADDAVVIGDGGDFVSFAGKYIEPQKPGNWLDPGPYGCLGTGLGYAMSARVSRPDSQVVLMLGDGAAGFSLMDIDTLVRHDLPVVMVVGNNSSWALEKHPMRFLYGYDVAAELRPTRYDEVASALGGAGETVTSPGDIGPAMDRAFDSGGPYLINVMTDPNIAYPRSTTGV
jgi:acetolactate synthase-1/2/3 large subunit